MERSKITNTIELLHRDMDMGAITKVFMKSILLLQDSHHMVNK